MPAIFKSVMTKSAGFRAKAAGAGAAAAGADFVTHATDDCC